MKLEESNDLLFRLRHAEVKALFVSKYQLPKIRRIRAELPQIEHVIVLGHIPLEPGETAYGPSGASDATTSRSTRRSF